jgi:hypothetical protein
LHFDLPKRQTRVELVANEPKLLGFYDSSCQSLGCSCRVEVTETPSD